MLKQALLGAAMLFAAPALAQVQDASPPEATAPSQPAATPTAPSEQVAGIVERQFGIYDTNADGNLDEAEFAAWMIALKTHTDPATNADAPATRQWNRAAFAKADTDRNRSLTRAELTGFLLPEAQS